MDKMKSEIVKSSKTGITIQIKIPKDEKEMLTTEEYIEMAVNQAKLIAMEQQVQKNKGKNSEPQ
jgi:hypothetical protein